jgi:hypothetical protein
VLEAQLFYFPLAIFLFSKSIHPSPAHHYESRVRLFGASPAGAYSLGPPRRVMVARAPGDAGEGEANEACPAPRRPWLGVKKCVACSPGVVAAIHGKCRSAIQAGPESVMATAV